MSTSPDLPDTTGRILWCWTFEMRNPLEPLALADHLVPGHPGVTFLEAELPSQPEPEPIVRWHPAGTVCSGQEGRCRCETSC